MHLYVILSVRLICGTFDWSLLSERYLPPKCKLCSGLAPKNLNFKIKIQILRSKRLLKFEFFRFHNKNIFFDIFIISPTPREHFKKA